MSPLDSSVGQGNESKISGFGWVRIFRVDETVVNTIRPGGKPNFQMH